MGGGLLLFRKLCVQFPEDIPSSFILFFRPSYFQFLSEGWAIKGLSKFPLIPGMWHNIGNRPSLI
jgi:hypothetical protein